MFLLVAKNVLLAKESGSPHSELHRNPLTQTQVQLLPVQNLVAKSQSSKREQERHAAATSDMI